MGMLLTSQVDDASVKFTTIEWSKLLELGRKHGWIPIGTRSDDEETWNGNYESNDGQLVIAEDSLALAAALDKVQLLPTPKKSNLLIVVVASYPFDHNIKRQIQEIASKERKYWGNLNIEVEAISYFEETDPWLKRMIFDPKHYSGDVLQMHNYRLDSEEFYAGQQQRINEFIAFCQKGEFKIY